MGADASSALHDAARRGDDATVKSLIEKDPSIIDKSDCTDRTAFMTACSSRQWGTASLLMDLGTCVESRMRDLEGRNFMHLIALADPAPGPSHIEQIDEILQRLSTAFMNSVSAEGETALHFCAQRKDQLALAQLLVVEHGADVNICSHQGRSPLYEAVLHRNKRLAELFVDHGADVRNLLVDTDEGGKPLSQIAVAEKWTFILEKLSEQNPQG